MKIASYLIYTLLYEGLCIGGTGYAVFVLGHSGWWWVLGAVLSGCIYKPERWSALWDDTIAEKYRKADAAK
jgi:hypothetical protein